MEALLILVALGVGGVILLARSGSAEAAAQVHVVGSRGWVEAEPSVLAAKAGVSDSVYALASAMVSEAGGSNDVAMTAVGWALRNHAIDRGESILRVLTRAGRNDKSTRTFIPHDSDGYFAPQNVGPRWASTRKPPTARALEIAAQVLANDVDDPTGGATQFDAPKAQEALLGVAAGYTKTADEVAEARRKTSDEVYVPGVSSIRFWVPRG